MSALSKRQVPEDFFRRWIGPLSQDLKVRRDLAKYFRNIAGHHRVGIERRMLSVVR